MAAIVALFLQSVSIRHGDVLLEGENDGTETQWTSQQHRQLEASTLSTDTQEGSNNDSSTTQVDNLYLSLPTKIIAGVLATLLALLSIGSAYFVYKYRKRRVVAVGQPPFLYMICFGTFLSGLASFFTTFATEDTSVEWLDNACLAQQWFLYLGEITIYGALSCKLYRVKQVTTPFVRRQILVRHVIGPLILTMVAAVGLLIAWSIDDPPTWQREELSDDGNVLRTYGVCDITPQQSSVPYDGILSSILGICVLVAFCLSCAVRKTPEDISDSKRVFQLLGTILVLTIVTFLFLVLADWLQNFGLLFFALFVSHFLGIVAAIGLMILPKLIYVRYEEKHGRPHPAIARGGGGGHPTVHVTGLRPPIITSTETSTARAPSNHSSEEQNVPIEEMDPENIVDNTRSEQPICSIGTDRNCEAVDEEKKASKLAG